MTASAPAEARPILFQPFVMIGLVGMLFTVVGGIEVVTLVFPLSIGNPEWEFGTYSAVMDSMPPLLMGLGFLGVFAVVQGHRALAKSIAVLAIVLALLLIAFAFLYGTNVPQALRVNPRSPIQTGIKKAVAKASFQTAIIPVALIWLGAFLARNSGRRSR